MVLQCKPASYIKQPARRRRTALCLAACFVLPAAIMTLVYYFYDIAPFGDRSVLIMDMSAQYSEFFCGLKHISPQNGGILFSWSKVFGSNYAGVFAYYVSSPLSVLTLLCPNEYMPVGLMWLTVIKIGLSGLTFGIFLCKMLRGTQSSRLSGHIRAYIPAFAVFYALMSYSIVYSMCVMWLDAVIWLPIVILGTETVACGGKPYILFISLSFLFISTYYISYMVGIFACIYLLFALVRQDDTPESRPGILSVLVKFVGSAVSAACMGAWLLLPALCSLYEGKISGSFMGSVANTLGMAGTNYDMTDIYKKFFIGTYDSITNSGTPFIYCGMVTAALYFIFFFTESVSKRDKVMTFAITAFIGMSTYFESTDTAWHVFQRPNWFPYRYLFILSFFVIFTAARAFVRIHEVPYSACAVFFMISGIFYAGVLAAGENEVGDAQRRLTLAALTAALVVVTAAVLICGMRDRIGIRSVNAAAIALSIAFCGVSAWETYTNARLLTEGLDKAHRYESYSKYTEYKKLTQSLAESAETLSDGEFYRMGSCFQRNFNESIGLGYAGISHYSSSFNGSINAFLRKMGFAQIYMWSSYAGSTAVTDSLFSVKYVMSDPAIDRLDDRGRVIWWSRAPYDHYVKAAECGTAVLYENPYVLPPCIAVSGSLKGFGFSQNAVESQNTLLNLMTDGNTSYFIKMTEDSGAVMTASDGSVSYSMEMPRSGPLYAVLPAYGNSTAYMKINGEYETKIYTGETDCVQFLGSYGEGERVNISISGYGLRTDGNAFYQLDINEFEKTMQKLRENALNIEEWNSGYIKGSINAQKDGCAFTSLVYDESWKVYVDGKRTDTWAFEDGLLCFDITAGTHEIELEYSVPGSVLGTSVTLCFISAAACAAAYNIIRKRGKTKNETC